MHKVEAAAVGAALVVGAVVSAPAGALVLLGVAVWKLGRRRPPNAACGTTVDRWERPEAPKGSWDGGSAGDTQ